MTPPATQSVLDFPAAPPTTRRAGAPGSVPLRAPTRAARTRTTYSPPVLTPELAAEQARQALTAAELVSQVSRVVVWPTDGRPGVLTTVALLRVGADPDAVHAVLVALPGVRGSWCGQASVSVYRTVAGAR